VKSRLLNLLLSQAGWFACVLGSAAVRPWLGAGIALALVAIHLLLVKDRSQEIRLLLVAGLLGTTLDTVQGWLGIVVFRSGYLVDWLCPVWIMVLWVQFATLLHFCLRWLSGRYGLAALFGMVGGPIAFYAGARLGAAELQPTLWIALGAFALEWALAMPVLLWLAGRFPVRSGYRLLDADPA
jgi:hypothetical protein